MSFSVAQIAEALDVKLIGDPQVLVSHVAAIESAGPQSISFVTGAGYLEALRRSQAAAVIVPESLVDETSAVRLVSADPYLSYARLTRFWVENSTASSEGVIHPSAVVHDSVSIGRRVSVAANVTIDSQSVIADGVQIGAGSYIGPGCRIGPESTVHPNVTILDNVVTGAGCEIHSGAVIGADGFGWAPSAGGWEKIHQLGSVTLGDRVSVGACTTIDRGALDDTVLADGVILDNQIQIAHNVYIGENTAIAGCTGIAGSTRIGRNCRIAGAVSIVGHIDICDNVMVTANSFVNRSIRKPGSYSSGFPLEETSSWRKNAVRLHKLDEIVRGMRKIKQ